MIDCRCTCDWPVYTDYAIEMTCPRCGELIKCDGESNPNPPNPTEPIEYEKWPWWAKQIASHQQTGEVGVGDTAKRLIELGRLDTLASIAGWLGVPCGCGARHARWNKLYPYR